MDEKRTGRSRRSESERVRILEVGSRRTVRTRREEGGKIRG